MIACDNEKPEIFKIFKRILKIFFKTRRVFFDFLKFNIFLLIKTFDTSRFPFKLASLDNSAPDIFSYRKLLLAPTHASRYLARER